MAGADSKFGKKEQEEKDGRKLLKLFVAHNALKIQKTNNLIGTLVSIVPKGLLCVAFTDSTLYCLQKESVDSLAWTLIFWPDNNICFLFFHFFPFYEALYIVVKPQNYGPSKRIDWFCM